MDRRGKERLIGAGLLVALAVLVVPELLSGPKPEAPAAELPQLPAGAAPEPVRNVTLDLTTSKAAVLAPSASQPPASPAAPAAPASPSAGPDGATPSASTPSAPAAVSAPAASQAPPLETAAPPPRSQASFAVQLGSFANRSNAENLVHQLKAQGYGVYVSPEGAGKAARYRVRVGPLNDRETAERTIAKLKTQGHAATLIPPR
jgi:DedD protein